MSNATIRRKWHRWLKMIRREVQDLVISRHIYAEVGRIVKANERVQTPGDFHTWLSRNYAFCMAIGIRRLGELEQRKRKRSISLSRLLEEMSSHPMVMTRKSHVLRYQPLLQESASQWFNRFTRKPGALHIHASVPQAHLRSIKSASKQVKVFVDQRIAHLDPRNTRRRPLRLQEVDQAVDTLERIYLNYERLFTGSAPPTLLPTWQYDWQKIFAIPWITNPPRGWITS